LNNKQISGFTLVEVIFALLIICIVISGFSRFLYTNMQARYMVEDKNMITNCSQTIVEYIKSKNLQDYNGEYTISDFIDLEDLKNDYDGIDKLLTGVKVNINEYNDEYVSENLYCINITVKWKKKEKINTYELSTLIYQGEV